MGIFDVFGEIIQDVVATENATTAYQNGIQTSTPPAGAGGNGYRFTPDEMQSVLSDWQSLQGDIENAKASAQQMTTTVGPGTENASDTAVNGVNLSGTAYLDHLTAMGKYADTYIQALKSALTNYQNAEESGRSSMSTVQTQL